MIARELYHVHQTTFEENGGRKQLERGTVDRNTSGSLVLVVLVWRRLDHAILH